ncbi:MAG: class I SAM-dependent methyltransferase, partial [Ardenticatenaceae bacterium]
LIRAMEARLFQRLGPLPRPVLDVGCGDGHFAEVVWGEMDVGVDLDSASLREAQRRAVYDSLCLASATTLPFADQSFASAVSNCVIEHIPEMPRVLAEVCRVLKPDGLFVFSVPTNSLNDHLSITRLLAALDAGELAERYKSWFTRMQVHFHMYSPDRWASLAEEAGFEVLEHTGYMSARAAALFDLGHFYGIPNLISRRLTGRWVPLPWRPRFALEERLLAPLVAEHDPPSATCYFFVARKR